MAKLLKLRRGTTSQHSSFTGAEGEVTVDMDKDVLVVHDGSTQGGHPIAAEDMANVSSAAIAGRLGTDSIAVGKIAAGTLPSDVKIVDANVSGNLTIESADIVNGTIVNDDINASAAIANSKLADSGVSAGSVGSSSAIPVITVNAKGIITGTSTTAIDSTTIANGTSNVAVANNGDITATRSGTARLVVDDAGVDVTGVITATQNASFTGGCSAASFTTNNGNIIINSQTPLISFVDSDQNPDYQIKVTGGVFDIIDTTNSASRFSISSTGETSSEGKLNCQAGLDTDGDVVFNSDTTNVNITLDASTSTMNFSDSMALSFGDHSTTGDYQISYVNGADFTILAMAGGSEDLIIGRYENSAVKKHIVSTRAGVAELYHDNTKHLETQTGGVAITGALNVSGDTKVPDSSKFIAGTGDDLQIYHNGNHSIIADVGTGNLQLRAADFRVTNSDNSETMIAGTPHGSVDLYYDNTKKFETTTAGASIAGSLSVTGDVSTGDNGQFTMGANDDLALWHDGSSGSSYIAETGTGSLVIKAQNFNLTNPAGNEMMISAVPDGAANLYNDGTLRLNTSSGGVDVTGDLYATGKVGRDSTDYIDWSNNTHLDAYVNGSNVARFEQDGDLQVAADVVAYSTALSSDENLKKDITTVTDAITKAEALKGVTFTWKKDDRKSAGVIAQDVEKVLPEAVRTISNFDGDEFKAVNYGAITSILIEAVKELSAKVKVLEAK